jgi:hypothetical protein
LEKTTGQCKWEGFIQLAAQSKLCHLGEEKFVTVMFRGKKILMAPAQPGRTQDSFKYLPRLLTLIEYFFKEVNPLEHSLVNYFLFVHCKK